jgi:hypothetical protein
MPILMFLLYLAVHAGLYFRVLRDWQALGSERGVFLSNISFRPPEAPAKGPQGNPMGFQQNDQAACCNAS